MLCAGCVGGLVPPATTRTAGVTAAVTVTISPTVLAVTPTLPPSPSALPARPTATALPRSTLAIDASNAVSVTQVALLAPEVVSGTAIIKIEQVAWAPSGRLAAASAIGVLWVNGNALTATSGYTQSAWTLAVDFSSDGRRLATGSVDGTARIFETAAGALALQIAAPNPRVARVRFRPGAGAGGGALLATLGGDNRVSLWDIPGARYLGQLDPGHSSAGALGFSGDGRWLAAAGQQSVLVWDVERVLQGNPVGAAAPLNLSLGANVTSVAVSADGRRLAAGGSAGVIQLWELPSGRPLGVLRGVGAAATQLAFSPDGLVLASAHLDRLIRLWAAGDDGAAGPLITLAGHTDVITSLAFSANGSRLASSSWDGTVRLWAAGPSGLDESEANR
jgi:WD40 repeat protein